jgi:hypothetical protein
VARIGRVLDFTGILINKRYYNCGHWRVVFTKNQPIEKDEIDPDTGKAQKLWAQAIKGTRDETNRVLIWSKLDLETKERCLIHEVEHIVDWGVEDRCLTDKETIVLLREECQVRARTFWKQFEERGKGR